MDKQSYENFINTHTKLIAGKPPKQEIKGYFKYSKHVRENTSVKNESQI